ncbi:MAG: MFS transporter [Rhodospirillales bacterium]|nr:MFS transporter [Rhodospirillales bacterium]
MPAANEYRNVAILFGSQAMHISSQIVLFTLAGLVGQMLAEDKAFATLPVSAIIVATAMTTIPASLLMKRIGRRAGFMIGSTTGLGGVLIASYAVWSSSFWLFVLGTFVVGINGGFAQYYRFAAADAASREFRPRAISYVIAGGIAAAFIGPQLVRWTNDLLPVPFLGSVLSLSGLVLVSLILLSQLSIPKLSDEEIRASGRPLFKITSNPTFIVSVLSGMVGYGSMSMLMTATPIAMVGCGFNVTQSAGVIQWHVLGMFGPALFTGHLIHRFGVLPIIFSGLVLLMACIAVALAGIDIMNFTIALIALGLGWNFTFVGASSLLTETYHPAERAKVQATNDFLVFGTAALGSLSAGAMLDAYDWNTVNLFALPLIMLTALVTAWYALTHHRKQRQLAEAEETA